jgi:hypothetical protein
MLAVVGEHRLLMADLDDGLCLSKDAYILRRADLPWKGCTCRKNDK